MTLKESLLKVAGEYARTRELSLSRVSTLAMGDGQRLASIRAGADLTTGRYEATMAWFSANWPEGAVWPSDVARPACRVEAAE